MGRESESSSITRPSNGFGSRLKPVTDENLNSAVGRIFAEELSRLGVEMAVISPGSRSTPLALAFERNSAIEVEVVLDERSAAFYALGAAQATGNPVALVCTSGSAAANYHPAVVEADLSSIPLLVLTSDRPPELRGIGSGQAIDQLKLYGDAVRWFADVGTPTGDDDGLLYVRQLACRACATAKGDPRPGPVHLNFPFREPLAPRPGGDPVTAGRELATSGRQDRPLTSVLEPVRTPGEEAIVRAVELLDGRERVAIVAGRLTEPGIREPVVELAEALGAPILAEPTSQLRWGPHRRDSVIWAYGTILGDAGSGVEVPDVVVRIGETPTSASLRRWLAGLDETEQLVIRPEGDWYEPSRIAGTILRSDLVPTLEALGDRVAGGRSKPYLDSWLAAQAANEPEGVAAPIHRAVAGSASDGTIVYTASSLAIREQELLLPPGPTDITFLANRGTNGIDGLIGSAAGASVGAGREVIVVTGDLGLIHDMSSLPLIRRPGARVKVVVVNDGGGRIFESLPAAGVLEAGEFERLMLAPSDLSIERVSGAAGVEWTRVSDEPGLEAALGQEAPLVIEYGLDRPRV